MERAVQGTLTVHPDGYGFLLPDRPGLPDIFIPARAVWPAMHRDRVRVEVRRGSREGRFEGRVMAVLERGTKRLIGQFERAGKGATVSPDDARIRGRIVIPPDSIGTARHGDAVAVEIVAYPEGEEGLRGRVVAVLGRRGTFAVEVEAAIGHHDLPTTFSPEVERAAEAVHRRGVPPTEVAARRDLRHVPLVTIDGETARDFDDAVAAVAESDGGIRVWVAIADVGFYVEPGTPLDREAAARGTSVYFPDRCLPMFPPPLADDLCSLRPATDRLAVVAEFLIAPQGGIASPRFYRATIRSRARLTYIGVQQSLDRLQEGMVAEADGQLTPMLQTLAEATRRLRAARMARGSLDFDLPEPEILLDMEGGPEAILRAPRYFAHQMIEELMIAANEAVARFLTHHGQACCYRVHEGPTADHVREFGELAKHLGLSVRFHSPPRSQDFARLLTLVRGRPEERWINHRLLRSMAQAIYDTKNIGHFGLASQCYCHFTSPIRRYPDLVVHRLLLAALAGGAKRRKGPATLVGSLQTTAEHSSRRERVALEAEREMAKLYAAFFLRERIGQVFDGVISHVTKFGFYVELQEYFVEGLVRCEDLTDDRYRYDAERLAFIGRRSQHSYSVGSRVRIRVFEVKVESREIRFVIDLS